MGFIQRFLNEYRGGILYIAFGGVTTVINWLSYMVFVWLGIDINISNILSWICGVSFAFVANKWFVFASKSVETTTVARELGSFLGARIFTGIIGITLFPILYSLGMDGMLFGTDGFMAKITASLIEIILNWIFSKYLVFIKRNGPENSEQ